jgi:DNA processing protein
MEKDSILLYLNYIGVYSFHKSINTYKTYSSVTDLVNSNNKALSKLGYNENQISKIKNSYNEYASYNEEIINKGIIQINYFDSNYPESLKKIYSPPVVINCIGNVELFKKTCSAIVGSRKASSEGRKFSFDLAKTISSTNTTVVSGLAYGIDTQAHLGALEATGSTIAVLGSGVDIVYPKKNHSIYMDIINSGLVLSEYPLGTSPQKHYFPARNRIISGLSSSVSIIEASEKSGSLITAEYAIEQGKDIFTVPGNIYNQMHKGSNQLLKNGAIPLLSTDDFIDYYNLTIEKVKLSTDNLNPLEIDILSFIENNQPIEEESIYYNIDLPHGEIASVLTVLEIDGYIEKLTPTVYIKKTSACSFR